METVYVPCGRDIPRDQARKEIKAIFAAKEPDKLLYLDDIMETLDLRYELVAEICRELEQTGEIKGV